MRAAETSPTTQPLVPRWGVFEVALNGPNEGNPFQDVRVTARFSNGPATVTVIGFYDGQGVYRVRFMPESQGIWSYQTQSNRSELSGKSGQFMCVEPTPQNHGPVRVAGVHHFAYADGTPMVLIGTTAYSWAHEPEPVEDQTLDTLKNSPFNKVRMCVLPGAAQPIFYPYERDSQGKWDSSRFNVQFFRHLEKRIAQLGQQGVEADLILFHPYEKGELKWFDAMDDAEDDRYLHYVVSRFSAYHNVWWSLANEYGQVKGKTDADWDHFFQLVAADDPYGHLRSVHNAQKVYDYNKPWVTHATIQNGNAVADFGRAVLMRELIPKPVVYDEVCYEGHSDRRWGQLSGEEMVMRFWLGTIAGTYVGHGETLGGADGLVWTGSGGQLRGQSPPRLAFLRKILEEGPRDGIEPIDEAYESHIGGRAGEYYLIYFGKEQPTDWPFALPRDPPDKNALAAGMKFAADVLDTWNMTVTPMPGTFTIDRLSGYLYRPAGDGKVTLPGKPYIAIRLRRV